MEDSPLPGRLSPEATKEAEKLAVMFAETCWGTSAMASGVHVAEQKRRIRKDMMMFNVYN